MNAALPDAAPDRIGDRFVHAGVLTAAQAARAAQLQQDEGLRFGEAAVRLGFITPQDVQAVLSEQFHYPVAAESHSGIASQIAIAHAPFSPEAEAIRRIRGELAIRLEAQTPIAFAVVSPDTGEGKSYLAASLAIAFAQAGSRTLLIDANMRGGSGVPTLFGVAGETGLSSMLAGRAPPTPGVPVPRFPTLHVLGAGPTPPNPVEILYDAALRDLVRSFEPGFDITIVDTPAARRGSDAQVIAQQIGTCLLVARKDITRIADLAATQDMLATAGVQVVGTVYNQFDGRAVRRGFWRRLRPGRG